MASSTYPHVFPVIWEDVVFCRDGIGAIGRPSSDAALWVSMRPSVFLSIATPLAVPRASLEWLGTRIDDGAAIAPAELRFDTTPRMPLTLSHEGRHRMTALRARFEDRPVPVRLSFQRVQDHEVDRAFVDRVRSGVRSQRGRTLVEGPLFDDGELDVGDRWRHGIPPPVVGEDFNRCLSILTSISIRDIS